MQRELDQLDSVLGDGTTLISLYVPATGPQLVRAAQLIVDEQSAAQNIKSRKTAKLVSDGLRMIQQRLPSNVKHLPENGVAIFCGVNQRDGRTVIEVLEPCRPLPGSVMYKCGKKFYTEPLREQLMDADTFGVVVVTGKGAMFGTICGSQLSVLGERSCHLPPKHGRGGQSSARFARQRV